MEARFLTKEGRRVEKNLPSKDQQSMLPKKYRLKDKNDFQRAYKEGRFFSFGDITVHFIKNRLAFSRFGFVVGKAFSKSAVDRNRARRILRASAEKVFDETVLGVDFVIGIKRGAGKEGLASSKTVSESLKNALDKNNLLSYKK